MFIAVAIYTSLNVQLSLLQKCGFSVDPSSETTIEATFTPDGQYVVSGTTSFPCNYSY